MESIAFFAQDRKESIAIIVFSNNQSNITKFASVFKNVKVILFMKSSL